MGRNKLKKCNIVTFFRAQTLCRNWIYIFLLIIYFIYNILRAKTTVIRTFIVSKIIEYHEMDNKRTCKSRSVRPNCANWRQVSNPRPLLAPVSRAIFFLIGTPSIGNTRRNWSCIILTLAIFTTLYLLFQQH